MNMTDKGTVFLFSLNINLKKTKIINSKQTNNKNKNKSSMGNLKRKDHSGEDKGCPENKKDTPSRPVRFHQTWIKECLLLQRPCRQNNLRYIMNLSMGRKLHWWKKDKQDLEIVSVENIFSLLCIKYEYDLLIFKLEFRNPI